MLRRAKREQKEDFGKSMYKGNADRLDAPSGRLWRLTTALSVKAVSQTITACCLIRRR